MTSLILVQVNFLVPGEPVRANGPTNSSTTTPADFLTLRLQYVFYNIMFLFKLKKIDVRHGTSVFGELHMTCNSRMADHLNRDNWARTTSPNPNVKVFLGAPAALLAAGTGYQAIGTMQEYAVQMRNSFPSFGGVMLW